MDTHHSASGDMMGDAPGAFDLWLRRDLRLQFNRVLQEDVPAFLITMVEEPAQNN